jgi:hypothetical protein
MAEREEVDWSMLEAFIYSALGHIAQTPPEQREKIRAEIRDRANHMLAALGQKIS